MSSDNDPTQYGVVRFGKGKGRPADQPVDRPDPDAGDPEKLAIEGNAPLPAAPPPSALPRGNRHPMESIDLGFPSHRFHDGRPRAVPVARDFRVPGPDARPYAVAARQARLRGQP